MRVLRGVADATMSTMRSQEFRQFVAGQTREKAQEFIGNQAIDMGKAVVDFAATLDKRAGEYNATMSRGMSQGFSSFNTNNVNNNTMNKKY